MQSKLNWMDHVEELVDVSQSWIAQRTEVKIAAASACGA
jgi:hypothetical protein